MLLLFVYNMYIQINHIDDSTNRTNKRITNRDLILLRLSLNLTVNSIHRLIYTDEYKYIL